MLLGCTIAHGPPTEIVWPAVGFAGVTYGGFRNACAGESNENNSATTGTKRFFRTSLSPNSP
ncbi:hypothetical protein GCM10009105_06010 [Dokdonella soli]|uniref:Uncharacterized protein n=1 Tax=Dokdonella soli TaxID=529810 RepID=A0ABN1ICR2_9GAMM